MIRRLQQEPENADHSRLFARDCHFIAGAVDLDALPPADWPEIAFAGRSNVGKSSLINALTGRRALAKTSQTPGRTRQINFFNLADRLRLVDLPGYGYARAPKHDIEAWTRLTRVYLQGRPNLRRVCLLIDIRHGLKPSDHDTMADLNRAAQPYRIVLTKADKLKPPAIDAMVADVTAALKTHPAALPEPLAVSARTGAGIKELQDDLAAVYG